MRYEFEERDYDTIQRNSARYLVIEKFKDYELTECLAFEMAIRTKKGKAQIALAMKAMEEYESIYLAPPPSSKIRREIEEEETLHGRGYLVYLDDVSWHPFEVSKWIKRVPIHKNAPDFKEATFSIKKGLTKFKDEHRTIKRNIYPRFTCPTPSIRKDISKEIDITLNLALPKEELLAYVEALKDNYDKDHESISFENEVELVNPYKDLNVRGMKGAPEVPNMKKRLYADMFFVYDCLSTEDGKKHRGSAIQHIMHQLEEYYAEVLANDIINNKHKERIGDDEYKKRLKDNLKNDYNLTRTDKTIKEYYKKMVDFIDNERYKELLTGIKQKEKNIP